MLQSDPDDETLAGVLTHEFAHAVLDQNLRNPWRDLPTWVHEGVATWVQAKADDDLPFERLLAAAHREGRLRSLRGLQGYLPIDREGASLVYAQSYSMVKYLVNRYGIEDLRSMLQALSEGSTEDEALMAAYGFGRAHSGKSMAPVPGQRSGGGPPRRTGWPERRCARPIRARAPIRNCRWRNVSGEDGITPADTLIGSPELPPADAGTRAFIAITGLTVIALFRPDRLPGLPALGRAAGERGRGRGRASAVCVGPAGVGGRRRTAPDTARRTACSALQPSWPAPGGPAPAVSDSIASNN